MTKVLHLSHHYGCLKDHQYVCKNLGIELTNMFSIWDKVIPKNCYRITKQIACQIWNTHKDYFNSYEYILVSDTSPLSRIFLENISEFKGTLIVWVCNRFNYDMYDDVSYNNLFAESIQFDNVIVIPYTEFERVWARNFGVNIIEETINPIGVSIDEPLSEYDTQDMIGFDGSYDVSKKEGDVLVSRYHNDVLFQDSCEIFKSYNLVSERCKYKGFSGLKDLSKNFHSYFILPEQYSKLVAFELMNIQLPVILPSENFLLHLSQLPNYWFGSGVNNSTIKLCEWYNEYYDKFAIYIDDFSDIPYAFETIVSHKKEICDIMKRCGDTHKKKTLNQWRKIYNV